MIKLIAQSLDSVFRQFIDALPVSYSEGWEWELMNNGMGVIDFRLGEITDTTRQIIFKGHSGNDFVVMTLTACQSQTMIDIIALYEAEYPDTFRWDAITDRVLEIVNVERQKPKSKRERQAKVKAMWQANEMSISQMAAALWISDATVKRDLRDMKLSKKRK